MAKIILSYTLSSVYFDSLFEGDLTLVVILLSEVFRLMQHRLWFPHSQSRKFNAQDNRDILTMLISVAAYCALFSFDRGETFFKLLVPHELNLFKQLTYFVGDKR